MPVPKVVGRWNKAGLNHLTRHIAPRMPGLGVVVHRGRRSGRRYQTPVNVFRAGDGYVIALTYGPETDWVKNVLAAGGCELRTRGQTIPLGSPRLFHDQSRSAIRPVERQVLRILHVADFPHACAGQPGSTRPIPSLTAPGGSTTNRQRKVTTGLTGQSAQHRRSGRRSGGRPGGPGRARTGRSACGQARIPYGC
jgi:deazaflavin-dependent oxidoreductase (nitroreductase family)